MKNKECELEEKAKIHKFAQSFIADTRENGVLFYKNLHSVKLEELEGFKPDSNYFKANLTKAMDNYGINTDLEYSQKILDLITDISISHASKIIELEISLRNKI